MPEAPTPPDTDEEDAPDRQVEEVPGGEIDADEGKPHNLYTRPSQLTDTVQTYWTG